MKIKLLIITILLLFITFSSEIMAQDLLVTTEIELVIEEDKSEKEIDKQDLILIATFKLPSIDVCSVKYTEIYLYNYLSVENTFKPPID